MIERSRPACPLCGNERVVRVARFVGGYATEERGVCVGPLGCHKWFDPATGKAVRKGWDEIPEDSAPDGPAGPPPAPRPAPPPARTGARRR